MLNLHELYQLKVYDGMHNVVNTKQFNSYPTVIDIQNAITEKNGAYAKVEKRYYMINQETHSHDD